MIRGAAPGKMTVVTGVPGSGKSTVIGRIVLGQVNRGRRVCWGAWEEGPHDSLEQLAVMSLGWSREAFSSGHFEDEHLDKLDEEMERLRPFVRFFALPRFERGKSRREALIDRALDTIYENVVASACEVFVADLWRRAVRAIDPDEEELALYRQQDISAQTGAHGLLVHQQRLKDVEQRLDPRPTREGMKGSGAWVEAPDTILGVYRPSLFKAVADDTLQVPILKQRKAPWPLCVEFTFDPDTAQLTDGRSVDVMRAAGAGADGLDGFLEAEEAKHGRGSGRRKR
jgi:hypothetical protein